MFAIRLITFFTCCLLASSNPIQVKNSEDFFFSLTLKEQSALAKMIAEASGLAALQISLGSSIIEVNLEVPDVISRRVQETKESDFKNQLISWIGRQWFLSEESLVDLQSNGRGCGTRFCLSIKSRSNSENCCPLG